MSQFAVFDLDLTLTTRHLWKDLFYHRRESAELWSQSRDMWIAEQGGPEEFEPPRLQSLFDSLTTDGFQLGIATYNKSAVARAFLHAFAWEDFFATELIQSRDTADDRKSII